VFAVVEGDEDAGLRAGQEQSPLLGILADDVDVAAHGDAGGDRVPGLASVARPVDMRGDVVQPVAIHAA
jgi:hypothetical protein